MQALRLTIMERGGNYPNLMRQLLDEFKQQSGVEVELEVNSSWSKFTQYAFNRRGPDVSEVGTTRNGMLVSMDALTSFTFQEIMQSVLPEDFSQKSWETCRHPDMPGLWGVPFMGESYVIQYRKDILRQAGIDETTAFDSFTHLDETLACLSAAGVDVPMELQALTNMFPLLHGLAAWVWSAGGEYCSNDGKQVLVNQPVVLAAITRYMGALRYASEKGRQMMLGAEDSLFLKGQAAVTLDNYHWRSNDSRAAPVVLENWGTAIIPGEHFAGGSNLAVWKFCRNEKAAIALVQFLTSHNSMLRLTSGYSRLTQRLSIIELPEIQSDPHMRVMGESIRTGRTYPSGALWGVMGDRLGFTLNQIGQDVLTHPTMPVDEIVARHIATLVHKLNLAFSKG